MVEKEKNIALAALGLTLAYTTEFLPSLKSTCNTGGPGASIPPKSHDATSPLPFP